MKLNCPNLKCISNQNSNPNLSHVIRKGSYFRSSDSRRIRRFVCLNCKIHFSAATRHPCFAQKKRRINHKLRALMCSGVSQRRAAILLGVNRKTVVRHFRCLAHHARLEHEIWMNRYQEQKLMSIQFDDLETSEHTKCKPLSVSLAIDPIHRKILSFKVSQMPAKGHLAKIAFKKYGYRKDQRAHGWNQMMRELKPFTGKNATFISDENPHYPKALFAHHPYVKHVTTKGGRGCISGQGELKKLRFDPLFGLNHTCAMLRANLNRLFRKTWCTTKNKKGLSDHLALFVPYFNQVLTEKRTCKGAS